VVFLRFAAISADVMSWRDLMRTVIVRLRESGSDLLGAILKSRGDVDSGYRKAIYFSLVEDYRESSRGIMDFLQYTRNKTQGRLGRSVGVDAGSSDVLSIDSNPVVIRYQPLISYRSVAVLANEEAIEELRGLDEVEEVHDNFICELPVGESDSLLTTSGVAGAVKDWYLERIGIDPQKRSHSGRSVKVAILDTGLDVSHPEFKSTAIGDWMEWDDMGTPISGPVRQDDNGHGTLVSGILCGSTIGVAPEVELYVGRIAPKGRATFAQIGAGLDWAAANFVDIISMSVGKPGYINNWESSAAFMAQMLVVAAIGNQGPGTSRSPGDYKSVLSVGATDTSDTAWVSPSNPSRGSAGGMISAGPNLYLKPDIYAPGVQVRSSALKGGYQVRSGTSFAAPAVAGVAALVKGAKLSFTPRTLRDHLLQYSTPITLPASLGQSGVMVSASRALSSIP
jgi:subtilisin family serine protease